MVRAAGGEVIVDHQSARSAVISAVRGALLLSYIDRIKGVEHYPRYVSALPAASRDALLYVTAMSWVSTELALAHFDACDALALSDSEIIEHGYLAGTSNAPVMLGTLFRSAGMTPLTAVRALGRVWDRIHDGGGCIAIRTGLKDVFIEQRGNPAAASRFYRLAALGFYRALAERFCTRAYVRPEAPRGLGHDRMAVTISWV